MPQLVGLLERIRHESIDDARLTCDEICSELRKNLLSYIIFRVRDVHLAEDIFQMTMQVFWTKQRAKQTSPKWFFVVADRLCTSHFRKTKRKQMAAGEEKILSEVRDTEESELSSLLQLLDTAIETLPDEYRERIRIFIAHGAKYSKYAEFFGLSHDTARRELQPILAEIEGKLRRYNITCAGIAALLHEAANKTEYSTPSFLKEPAELKRKSSVSSALKIAATLALLVLLVFGVKKLSPNSSQSHSEDSQVVPAAIATVAPALPSYTMYVWGDNNTGQIGNGDYGFAISKDVHFPILMMDKVADFSGSGYFSLALMTSGEVMFSGKNDYGQAGRPADGITPLYEKVPGLEKIRAISAGDSHCLALDEA
ncbi:MAG: hypothetical protein Kow00107_03830 [Planctomycetota bacterium]